MNLAKKEIVPLSGVALGLAALGNLLGQFSVWARYLCGVLSLGLMVVVSIYMFQHTEQFKQKMKHPVMMSVFGTFSMAGMLLATYVMPLSAILARIIWMIFILLHIFIAVAFTKRFVFNFDRMNVFPSWYIVYVGIVVVSVTAPVFNALLSGQVAFIVGLVTYIMLLPIVFYRVLVTKQFPLPAQSSIAINAAPAALLLAGYVSSFPEGSKIIFYLLMIVSQALFLYVLSRLPKIMTKQFFPGFSAFTFPFVISALSLRVALKAAAGQGGIWPALRMIALLEVIFATVMVGYVFIRNMKYLFQSSDMN